MPMISSFKVDHNIMFYVNKLINVCTRVLLILDSSIHVMLYLIPILSKFFCPNLSKQMPQDTSWQSIPKIVVSPIISSFPASSKKDYGNDMLATNHYQPRDDRKSLKRNMRD